MDVKTLPELIQKVVLRRNNPTAFQYRKEENWVSISNEEFFESMRFCALGLKSLGLKSGQGVGILADSSPHWVMMDVAISLAGGITVPMFANLSTDNMLFEIEDSDIHFLFIASQEKWDVLADKRKKFQHLITLNISHGSNEAIPWEDLLKRGREFEIKSPHTWKAMMDAVRPDDIWTIIYTSGSTGAPKGVELTHRNLCSQVEGCTKRFDVHEGDTIVSCLPLAHIFERMAIYYFIWSGASIYYADDIQNVGNILREVKPTVMTLVPRLLEKVYAKMKSGIQEASSLRRMLGNLALKRALNKDPFSPPQFQDHLYGKLVYRKFRQALGGRFRMLVSGGAPLADDLYRFFINIGVPLYQGYGLTESSPVITSNFPGQNKIGTVGPPFPEVEVKVTSDGEILARGTNIMHAYHHNPEETRITVDKEGWLHTGDLGKIDEQGFLRIVGRKKEMFKTSNGKYVCPIPIEQELVQLDLIDMALVVAEGRKFVSCLLFPDFANLAKLKSDYGLDSFDDRTFLSHEKVQTEVQEHIHSLNRRLNHWEQIRKFQFVDRPATIEDGDLTPKMNLRRHTVEEKYVGLINSFYGES